jgi:hypothetical protein
MAKDQVISGETEDVKLEVYSIPAMAKGLLSVVEQLSRSKVTIEEDEAKSWFTTLFEVAKLNPYENTIVVDHFRFDVEDYLVHPGLAPMLPARGVFLLPDDLVYQVDQMEMPTGATSVMNPVEFRTFQQKICTCIRTSFPADKLINHMVRVSMVDAVKRLIVVEDNGNVLLSYDCRHQMPVKVPVLDGVFRHDEMRLIHASTYWVDCFLPIVGSVARNRSAVTAERQTEE